MIGADVFARLSFNLTSTLCVMLLNKDRWDDMDVNLLRQEVSPFKFHSFNLITFLRHKHSWLIRSCQIVRVHNTVHAQLTAIAFNMCECGLGATEIIPFVTTMARQNQIPFSQLQEILDSLQHSGISISDAVLPPPPLPSHPSVPAIVPPPPPPRLSRTTPKPASVVADESPLMSPHEDMFPSADAPSTDAVAHTVVTTPNGSVMINNVPTSPSFIPLDEHAIPVKIRPKSSTVIFDRVYGNIKNTFSLLFVLCFEKDFFFDRCHYRLLKAT